MGAEDVALTGEIGILDVDVEGIGIVDVELLRFPSS